MTVYWLSFRVEDISTAKGDWQKRYDGLIEALQTVQTKYWDRTTSLCVFESPYKIDDVVAELKKPLSMQHDLILIREMNNRVARISGKNDDSDIYSLMSYQGITYLLAV